MHFYNKSTADVTEYSHTTYLDTNGVGWGEVGWGGVGWGGVGGATTRDIYCFMSIALSL